MVAVCTFASMTDIRHAVLSCYVKRISLEHLFVHNDALLTDTKCCNFWCRKEYEKLRRQCHRILNCYKGNGLNAINEFMTEEFSDGVEGSESPHSEGVSKRACVLPKELKSLGSKAEEPENSNWASVEGMDEDTSELTYVDPCIAESESSDSESSYEEDPDRTPVSTNLEENCDPKPKFVRSASSKSEVFISDKTPEDFTTWQRIIRVDAIRANTEWALFARNQAEVSKEKALRSAISVGLKDYDHLEPYMIYHAARLVALLEAYALYDPEIGYCQGMSDLLSPIIAVMEEDHEAFWCFVGFMRKARHHFRLDEVGIRRQSKIVSQIIKRKESHLYRHLQKLQAEDCFFVYRMVGENCNYRTPNVVLRKHRTSNIDIAKMTLETLTLLCT